jgi:hypothetical protein
MTIIAPSRQLIQQEETQARASVSESTATKLGAHLNFHAIKQFDQHSWHLNGPFFDLPFIGPDGIFTFLWDAEIVGFAYTCGVTGISGQTGIDLRRISGAGADLGSIWSAGPTIQSTAVDGSFTLYRVSDSTTISLPAGHGLGVLNTVNFNQGDGIRLDISSVAQNAQNFQFTIMWRPR